MFVLIFPCNLVVAIRDEKMQKWTVLGVNRSEGFWLQFWENEQQKLSGLTTKILHFYIFSSRVTTDGWNEQILFLVQSGRLFNFLSGPWARSSLVMPRDRFCYTFSMLCARKHRANRAHFVPGKCKAKKISLFFKKLNFAAFYLPSLSLLSKTKPSGLWPRWPYKLNGKPALNPIPMDSDMNNHSPRVVNQMEEGAWWGEGWSWGQLAFNMPFHVNKTKESKPLPLSQIQPLLI